MKVNYYELWKRADKALNVDICDLSEFGEKESKSDEATACAVRAMMNAHDALKFVVMSIFNRESIIVVYNSSLAGMLNKLIEYDSVNFERKKMGWAFEIAGWGRADILTNGEHPVLGVATHSSLVKAHNNINRMYCLSIGGDVTDSWY